MTLSLIWTNTQLHHHSSRVNFKSQRCVRVTTYLWISSVKDQLSSWLTSTPSDCNSDLWPTSADCALPRSLFLSCGYVRYAAATPHLPIHDSLCRGSSAVSCRRHCADLALLPLVRTKGICNKKLSCR